ncbi:hypothetical protein [uncultured Brachyspira sp.]|uniref:hypothetical protein n=1 Tax=uncultured Brachyspira sp. TaxID=221953 RepID=UPI00262D2423|nr:hypothetical protein [uncultured Brachyspira sp.]
MKIFPYNEKSEIELKSLKLMELNFYQGNDPIIMDSVDMDLSLEASYLLKKEENTLQFNLSIALRLHQSVDIDKIIDIGVIQSKISGIFIYDGKVNEEIFPSLASILYSYLRPIVAQISVMAKLPPIDLPILDLSKIKADKIKE